MVTLNSRLALILLAGAVSSLSAYAGGYSPAVADADGTSYAIEKDGMTRKGYIVHAWQVANLATPKDGKVQSVRSLVEFNCRFRQSRTMWINEHADRDAGGDALTTAQVINPEWVSTVPGAPADKLLDFACSHIMR